MGVNVLVRQTPTNSGVNMEVVDCLDCKGKKPKKVPSIKAVENTTEGLDEYPEVEA